jgi:hypothetical protein
MDESVVGAALNDLIQLVEHEDRGYRLYHRSMADFLAAAEYEEEDSVVPNRYYTPAREGHARIVRYYLGRYRSNWTACDEYGLRHLSAHLYALRDESRYRKELYELISWPLMETKRARTGSDRSFAEDVGLAIQVASAEEPPNWSHLVPNILLHSTLVDLLANVPTQMLALLAQAGELVQAEDYALLLRDEAQQSEAYQQISAALLAKGDMDQAVSAAQRIRVTWRWAVALIPASRPGG